MTDPAWMLRTAEGDFGPLDFPTLQGWAAEGRFDGLDLVSPDGGAQWAEAAGLADLGLEWQLRLEDGELSAPVHALVVARRLADGEAHPDQESLQSSTGETFTAGDVAFSALLSQNEILTALLQETRQSLAAVLNAAPALPEPAPPAGPAAPEPGEWRTLIKEKDFFEKEANKWRKFYEDEVARNRSRERELSASMETLRASGQESLARALVAEKNCRHAEEKLEKLLTRNASSEASEGGPAFADAGEQILQIQEILDGRTQDLETALAARDQAQAELHRREKLHEELIRRERELCASQRTQLSRIERSYQELIISYRAMNDRLIQLQNGMGAGMRKAASAGAPPAETAPAAPAEPVRPPARGRIKLR